jgi:hypothetical protein
MGGGGVGLVCFLGRYLLGSIMADLAREFLQAVALAWLSFGMGVLLFRIGCTQWQTYFLSRALLFLSPFVLTCFGVHACRENADLAAMVAAKKAEGVSDGGVVRLVTADVVESVDGGRFERRQYNDGGAKIHRSMPPISGRTGRRIAANGHSESEDFRFAGSVLELPRPTPAQRF